MKDWITEDISKMKPEKLTQSINGELDVFNAKWDKVESYLFVILVNI